MHYETETDEGRYILTLKNYLRCDDCHEEILYEKWQSDMDAGSFKIWCEDCEEATLFDVIKVDDEEDPGITVEDVRSFCGL